MDVPGFKMRYVRMSDHFNRIGSSYSKTRQTDPRIGNHIMKALGDSLSVVNIGAGSGSYEPKDRLVIAVEPSAAMIRQRPLGSAPIVQADAEALPLMDSSVDAALAILTLHHWSDPIRGLSEMRRVARRRVVLLTWDEDIWESFWLVREYLPCIRDVDRPRAMTISNIESALGNSRVSCVPIPHDCVDGFHGAFWRRPEAYLDPNIRSNISTYDLLPSRELEEGLRRLAADIQSGEWEKRHRDLLQLDEYDVGYRLIVAEHSNKV